jgi:tight adherence protein B
VRAGAAAGPLLGIEGRRLRSQARATSQTRARRLGVTLMLPPGVCVLPALLVVGSSN